MQQIAPNVYTETEFIGCNTTFVVTDEGIVLIDTPESPPDSIKWRNVIRKYGQIKYIINTDPHGDHFGGNCFFDGIVVSHQGIRESIMSMPLEMVKGMMSKNPANAEYLSDFYLKPPAITFDKSLTLYCGKHTFQLMHVTGHSPYQVYVYIPEEKVVVTSDNVINGYQPGFRQAVPFEWLQSLDVLASLGDNTLVPGHGKICDSKFISEMKRIVRESIDTVSAAIKKGMTLDEIKADIRLVEDLPVEEGHPMTMEQIQHENIETIYHAVIAKQSGKKY